MPKRSTTKDGVLWIFLELMVFFFCFFVFWFVFVEPSMSLGNFLRFSARFWNLQRVL